MAVNVFLFNLFIKILSQRKNTFYKGATNKGNIKIFAISLVPGEIFVMHRSGQGKREEQIYFLKIEVQKTSNVF